MTDTTTATIHPFELAGLGNAPFRYAGYHRAVGPIILADGTQIGAPGQPVGVCDYCGQGIATVVDVVSSDGRRFGVGLDCAEKLSRADNRLADQATRVRAEIRRQQREAAAERRRAEREAARVAELERQRERNGGLTDRELRAKQLDDAAAAARARFTVENQWIVDVLRAAPAGDFVNSMIRELELRAVADLSPRAVDVVADIYAKQSTGGARRGTKRFDAAIAEFRQRAGVTE